MKTLTYEDKAKDIVEMAMEEIRDDADKAYGYAEELAMLVGRVENLELREAMDEKLSYVMLHIEKI